MSQKTAKENYTLADYRSFIKFLLDRITDPEILMEILALVNQIYCEN